MKLIRRQLYAIALALDLLLSALTGGAPMQTVSARLGKYRAKDVRIAAIGADLVDWSARTFFGQAHHCELSIAAYEAREAAVSSWSG